MPTPEAAREAREIGRWCAKRLPPGPPNLTVLTTLGPLLAKRVTPFRVVGYDLAKRHSVLPVRVETVDQMHRMMAMLGSCTHSALLMETPRFDVPNPEGRRRKAFFGQTREWLFLDYDKTEVPEGIDPTSPEAIEYIRSRLPEYLQGVAFVSQFTGSAGLKGRLIRLRFAFRLDGPIERDRLQSWYKIHNAPPEPVEGAVPVEGPAPVDGSLFSATQPHYTAAPIFEGVADPFAGRSRLALHPGRATVAVADLEAVIAAAEASIPPRPERRSRAVSGVPAGAWEVPACGWTGNAADYLRDDALGLHQGVNRLCWEFAEKVGGDASPKALSALADRIKAAAISNAEAGLLTGRGRDYILAETSRDAVARSYAGAVARGAALRTPENAAKGFVAALKDVRNAAAGTPRQPGFTVQEYALHAVRLGLSRLGPWTSEDLLRVVEAASGVALHPRIREVVEGYEKRHRDDYRRAHGLRSPGYEVETVGSVEDVEIERGSILAVKAPHGSGKTKIIGRKAKDAAFRGFMALVHRRSLEASISARLEVESYRNRGEKFDTGIFGESSTVIDSIVRQEIAKEFLDAEMVFADEAEQLYRHLAGEHTVKRLTRILPVLQEGLSDPDKTIVLLDAGLDRFTVEHWQALAGGKPVRVFEVPTPHRGTLRLLRDCTRKTARAAVLAEALEALQAGTRIVIATDTKKGAEKAHAWLQAQGVAGGLITGDRKTEETKHAFSQDPDGYPAEQGWDYLVYSPAIAAGVSLEAGFFGAVFGVYAGVVSPSDFLQMLLRVRTVQEWTVAVEARGHPAPATQAEMEDALERVVVFETVDPVSALVLEIKTREARDRVAHGLKLVVAAEHAGMVVERVGGGLDLDPVAADLLALGRELKALGVAELLSAPVLSTTKFRALRTRRRAGETLAPDETLAYDRARVCDWLGIEDAEALSAGDIEFTQRHENAGAVMDLFAGGVALLLDPDRDDLPPGFGGPEPDPLILRRFLLERAQMGAALLRGLGVDPITGAGRWTKAQAAEALAAVAADHGPILAVMGFRPDRWGSRTAETVRALLDRLGLRVASTGPRRGREYGIARASWVQMLGYALRTGRLEQLRGRVAQAAGVFHHLPDEDEEPPPPLPRWMRDALQRSGVLLEDPGWIMAACGASRATAFRRRREVAEIEAVGVRRFTAEIEDPERGLRSVEGITEIDDLDRLKQATETAYAGRVVRWGWAVAVSKLVTCDESSIELLSQTTNFETPPSDPQPASSVPVAPATPGRPDSPRESATQPDADPLGSPDFIAAHQLSPVRHRMSRKRGDRDRRLLLRNTPSPSLRRWLNPATTEERILIELALGLNDGNPLQAQEWIRQTAAMLRQQQRGT